MDTFGDVIQVLNALVFGAVAVVVLLQWRRRADAPSGWVAATFGVLAAVILVSFVAPDDGEGTLEVALAKLLICGIVLYPWFLFRFMASIDPPSPALRRAAAAVTAACVVLTLVAPSLPAEDSARPLWFELYALAIIGQWSFLSVVVGVRLWRAGDGQPSISRRRMRILATGSIMMALALLPGAVPAESQPDAVRVFTRLLPLASAVFFLVGFAPPGWVRTLWRRREQDALRRAEMQLMTVVTADEVARALLPHVADVFGGRGALLAGVSGRPGAVHGMTQMEALELAAPLSALRAHEPIVLEGQPGVLALPLQSGWLVVQASRYTPFFGIEELSLLQELGSFTDLALQRAELFERERLARLTLEQTNTELETLVYGVSHDLKSPLISLMGYLEYLKLDHSAALDDEGRHYLERMGASALYMQQLIQDLLELSRIGRVQTEASPVALADLVAEVAGDVRQHHRGLVLDVGSLPLVSINPVRARQLFTNLLENAVRHGGDEVHVRISSTTWPDGRVEISVADDGVGIPEPYRERVFGIFERLEARDAGTGGTGMGLAICRKIVEQVGGTISIGPSETGTDVRIVLSVASSDESGGRTVEEAHR